MLRPESRPSVLAQAYTQAVASDPSTADMLRWLPAFHAAYDEIGRGNGIPFSRLGQELQDVLVEYAVKRYRDGVQEDSGSSK